ncbi:hypothetical protein OG530_19340 [Streptomyces decoyicus]|uniref:hypothetical protein n=1 Tax=Streptomyces decoyicus TaxID=249567 RepID=UPI002E17F1EF
MPTAGDQLPSDPQSLARRLAAVERDLSELRAARRLEQATVGAGGVRIVNGGRHAMDTNSGVRMVDIGAFADQRFNHPDGTAQQGMWLRREDGSTIFSLFAGQGETNQAWSWRDRAGNQVLADDTASGSGLARPYLPVPMSPAFDGGWDYWPRTANTTMSELWAARIYKQQPKIVVVAEASMDTSGATGQIELTVGNIARGPVSVSFGAAFYTLGPYDISAFAHMQAINVSLTGRRATGTGAIRATIYTAYTVQS